MKFPTHFRWLTVKYRLTAKVHLRIDNFFGDITVTISPIKPLASLPPKFIAAVEALGQRHISQTKSFTLKVGAPLSREDIEEQVAAACLCSKVAREAADY